MNLSDSEKLAMLDEIISLSGLRKRPENAFTLTDYIDRCGECGFVVGKSLARRQLQEQVDAGVLETSIFKSYRYWWKAEECPE